MNPQALRLLFAGTPEFAATILQGLLNTDHLVEGVYTQPDRPAGRGRRLHPSPVKALAESAGIPVEQPATLNHAEVRARVASFQVDAMVVAAYGLVFSPELLAIPTLGCINVHASLLPRWRGAAPIQSAILNGDTSTGVSIMLMEEGLDRGPVLVRRELELADDETSATLHHRLSQLGVEALVDALPRYARGELQPVAQETEGVSYAGKIRKRDAELDWSASAIALERAIRAYNPWPVAYTWTETGERLRVWRAALAESTAHDPENLTDSKNPPPPGTVVRAHASGLVVQTGQGCLRVLELQRPGSKKLAAKDYLNAVGKPPLRLLNESSAPTPPAPARAE